MRRLAFLLALCVCASGCEDDPRASVRIVETRAYRISKDDRRIAIDVDVEANEALGKSVGNYCVSVLFPGDSDYRDRCHADLEDGDTKTFHYVTENTDILGGFIRVAARVAQKQTGREDVPVPAILTGE